MCSKKNKKDYSGKNNLFVALAFLFVVFFSIQTFAGKKIKINLYKLQSNIEIDSTTILQTPVILTKGNNNFIVYHTLEPVIKWREIKGANGYTVYIDEVDDTLNNDLEFRSSYYGLISKNEFKIFNDILEFNKTYKVKIRAYNKTSWSKYSDSVLIRIEVPKLETPVLQNIARSGSLIIKSTTPIFKWNKIKNANGYTVYIDEISNQRIDSVFISSYYGLVQKNEFIPLEGILETGKKYKLTVRAYNEYVWSKYSEPLIFVISNKGKVYRQKENSFAVKTVIKNNKIIWEKIPEANKYHIFVEVRETNSLTGETFRRVFDKETTEHSCTLDEIVVNGEYRWKIKAKIGDKWTPYTKYYNNGVIKLHKNDKTKNLTEEIFLQIKYFGLLNEVIVAAKRGNNVYLPLLQLLPMLQINHIIDYDAKTVKGFLTTEIDEKETYSIDFKNHVAFRNGKRISLPKEDFIEEELDYFVSLKKIKEILGINLKVDMKRLTVKINSMNTPLYKRVLNEKEVSVYKNSLTNKNYPLIHKRERHIFKGLFADYNFTANTVKNQKPFYSYNLGFGAEVLGGDGELFYRQTIFSKDDIFNLSFNQLEARWRYAFMNNRNISSITLGNNSAIGIQPYEYKGINITNEPLEDRKMFGKHKIEDKAKPGWTIEIYRNNQLIDITKSNEEGFFSFYLPFTYGTTLIELHLFGPNGEYEIKRKMYQIPLRQVPKGKLDYSLNFGALVSNDEKIFQGKTSYGISDWLTTTVASDVFIADLENSTIYNITSARIFNGNVIDLTIAPNALVGLNMNSLFPNLANVNIGAIFYDKNAKLNPANIEREINGSIFYPVYLGNNALSFLAEGRKLDYFNKAERWDLAFRSYLTYENITPSIELKYLGYFGGNRSIESTFLNFRLNYSFLLPLKFIAGNILDARFGYNMNTEDWEYLNLTFSTTLYKNLRVQLTHTTNFKTSFDDTQLRIIWDLPFLRSNTTMSSSFISQSIAGSVSYLQNLNEYEFNNRTMVGKSAAAFRFFLDENGNNRFDKNEKRVPNMDVELSTVGNKKIKKDGTILINELDTYSGYNVKLIERRNINPQWQPVYKKFSFITDPDNYKYIDIPFYEAAEISGSVNKKIKGRKIPVNGITIIVENKKNKTIKRLKTLSDGTFYYYGLQPGKYKIYIDSKQLAKLNLPSTPEYFDVEIKSISSTVKDIEYNFILRKDN